MKSTSLALLLSLASIKASAIQLNRPTGSYPVGNFNLELIDHSRSDAAFNSTHSKRALMVTVHYPSEPHSPRYPSAKYFDTVESADLYAASVNLPPGILSSIETNARVRVPINSQHGRLASSYPVVLFSPGFGGPRLIYQSMQEELASHGNIVISIDHTHDANLVQFPNGQIVTGGTQNLNDSQVIRQLLETRVKDTTFVLNAFESSVPGTKIPGTKQNPSFRRVTIFGHSLGGATSASASLADKRIIAAMNFDGSLWEEVPLRGLTVPFLGVGTGNNGTQLAGYDNWAQTRRNTKRNVWQQWLYVRESAHVSFSDFAQLAQKTDLRSVWPKEEVDALLGTIDGNRVDAISRKLVLAFVEFATRGRRDELLYARDRRVPEVRALTL